MEKVFASTCRIKILKTLAEMGETHVMELVRKTNSTWFEVDRNIKILEELNLVESRYCQNRRLIKLDRADGKVEAVLKALRILERTNLTQSIV
jgi:DNA-binding transcriptional ArsR family regulator